MDAKKHHRRPPHSTARRKHGTPLPVEPPARFSFIRLAVFLIATVSLGSLALFYARASASPFDSARQASLVNDPKSGMNYDGLYAIRADANNPCRGLFQIGRDTKNPDCTHGPDPASPGVNVSAYTPEKRLAEIRSVSYQIATDSQISSLSADQLAGTSASTCTSFCSPSPVVGSSVPCTTGGDQVQMVLLTDSTKWPEYNNKTIVAYYIGAMKSVAAKMETEVKVSARQSGQFPTNEYLRFTTDGSGKNCSARIKLVNTHIPPNPDFNTVESIMKGENLSYADRKYLIWLVLPTANQYCGIGNVRADNSFGQTNFSNTHTGYAMVEPSCFDSYIELHEVMHTLGAVQNSAPYTTGSFHCTDELDVMCYADGSNGLAYNGKPMLKICTAPASAYLLDCKKDNYFSTDRDLGSPNSTNYLRNHWNTANSRWMTKY